MTLAALTRSEAGSVVLHRAETIEVPAEPATVVYTTGAGDADAAGFLAAWTAGPVRSPPAAGSAASPRPR